MATFSKAHKFSPIMKTLSLSLLIILTMSLNVVAQDIKDMVKKINFPGDLPTPRFISTLPDSVRGISIVYEDLGSMTAQKLDQLKNIELVELRFTDQFELDREVELLHNFPFLKYLVLGDWKYRPKKPDEQIKLPKILASYKNIVALKFSGEWQIDYLDGLKIIEGLPNLKFLFFQNYTQTIPDLTNGLKQLKGISFQTSDSIIFPEWITKLSNLESISLAIVNYNANAFHYLNYVDVLTKLQKLPSLQSLYLSNISNIDGRLEKLKFNKLTKIELNSDELKANQTLFKFLANQSKLKSINISSSSPQSLDVNLSKLKQLTDLTITGRSDSLNVNINLKELTKLKSLKLSSFKLNLKRTEFPNNLLRLDLTGNHMKVLPDAILKLSKLETLILAYNSLIRLPANIPDLKSLKNLDLLKNRLKELPENFGELKNLQTLNIRANPIIQLPESMERLYNLTSLEIQYGNLTKLPANIGRLSKLKVLNLNDNFIEQLPESIVNLKNLKTLNLSSNQLIALPNHLGNMSALEDLNLNLNNIRRIPISIGKLQAMKTLNLGFNDLDSLPYEISELKSLQQLYLNTGEANTTKVSNAIRAIWREDDPNPNRKITVNHFKNFPEDLSHWNSLKKLSLINNSEINKEQLFKGLFSIPSKGFLLELQNCGISILPKEGWGSFFVKSLNLRDNQIREIPEEIRLAPFLSEINLNANMLKASPNNLNQYAANKYEKALWFVDLGLISQKELPRTDSMVLALINKSNNHYYRKEFRQAVELEQAAVGINDSLAMKKMFLTNMGEANYEVGNYNKAIDYLTKALRTDTAGRVKIMNFVVPDFEFRAMSYLKLKDTLSAINDYKILAEKYSDKWGDVGLLYRSIHQSDSASIAYERGIKKYVDNIDYFKKTKQSSEMHQLSLLELMIISEDFNRAIKYAAEIKKDFKLVQHIVLFNYLKASAEIGNNSFDKKSLPELLNYINLNKKFILGWGYDLFSKWLSITTISKDKKDLINDIMENIKL